MITIYEMLKLSEKGYSQQQIATSCNVSRTTVRDYVNKAKALNLCSKDLENLSESEIQNLFEKRKAGRKAKEIEINSEKLNIELKKKGMTLQLLWQEHIEANPKNHLSYSGFCLRIRRSNKGEELTCRRHYKGGEKLFLDFSGMKVAIEPDDGEKFEASIFVACLGASNLTYVRAVKSENLKDWLDCHIKTFEYLGGVPEILIPDNLKSGVNKACHYEPEVNRSYQELANHYNVTVIPTRACLLYISFS